MLKNMVHQRRELSPKEYDLFFENDKKIGQYLMLSENY